MNLHLRKYIFIGIGLSVLSSCFLSDLHSQALTGSNGKKGDLVQFSKERNEAWNLNYQRALKLSEELQFPAGYTDDKGRIVMLQRLGHQNRPVYYATDNVDAATIISTNQLWTGEDEQPYLTGEGMKINIWDGGSILDTHQEFQNSVEPRIRMRDTGLPLSNHSTHVAGTIGAAGINELAKGMAGRASLFGWDFNNDIAEMAIMASEGILVSNHSYGGICGWDYNSNNEQWYWYGDPELSENEDYQFGFYDQVSEDLDFIAWSAPDYLIVKSAGNDRHDAPPDQPVLHFVWDDGWTPVKVERPPDGGMDGYDCLTPMSVAKNILTVGAVDDNKLITSFSAFGPTDDGRIKPDVVACGMDVYSTMATSFNSYGYYNGTSMAAASVTGSIALLHQLQDELQSGVPLHSSTLKGLLIHTADEMGNGPGPDYLHGWGLLNIKKAADLLTLNAGNGGRNIQEAVLLEGESVIIPVEITSPGSELKITLSWTDPPGASIAPVLNSRESRLVNDLDLEIIDPVSKLSYFPWKLNPEIPAALATQDENHLDNVEQVLLPNTPSGIYHIKIGHTGTLSGGNQSYSLIISGISSTLDIFPPSHLQFLAGETSVRLNWNSPETGSPDYYKIYRNDLPMGVSADTFCMDLSVETNHAYEYYITSVYNVNGTEYESLGTNRVSAIPRTLRAIPFMVDFEGGYDDMLIENKQDGWLWGDSDSLSCYYLHFEANTTSFIAANSYTYGKISHVSDLAITMPLKLAGCNDVSVSFDYFFNTGIYDAIDILYVMYKLPGETEWKELEHLPRAISWTSRTISLPAEVCKDGTQIGFYYDDLYQWGLGAGLDNIRITGETGRSVDLAITSMISPVSSCALSDAEPVSITILNAGEEDALPGDLLNLHLEVSPGIQIEEQLGLTEVLHGGDILTYQMGTKVDLSEIGTYTFSLLLTSDLDVNVLNNTLKSVVEITEVPVVTIGNQDLLFCEEEEPVLIQCSPAGGTLSGTGVSGLYFDPGTAGPGVHLLTYSFTVPGGCLGTASVEVEVIDQPEPVILNEDLVFCVYETAVLIQCSPAGGSLTGPGVTGFYFDPGSAGTGIHQLTYLYSDLNGCQGTATVEVKVIAVSTPSILNEDLLFCEDEDPVLIQCTPVGGTLSGTGVFGLYFDPGAAGEGTHVLTYIYTDPNGCRGSTMAEVEVVAQPKPIILNEDPRFCEDESGVLIRCSPEGGTLSGKGVSGNNFYPREAGIGSNPVSYVMIYRGGCVATTSKDFIVNENPMVDLGSDRQIELDDTIELLPSGNGVSYNWFDTTTDHSKLIIANNLGVGDYDIWVEAFSQENCSAVDSLLLTIEAISGININENAFNPFVRPNPFSTAFNLEINENEIVKKISLYDLTGRIYSNVIPSAYPHFQVPDLPAGSYILKVETKAHIYLIRIVKI